MSLLLCDTYQCHLKRSFYNSLFYFLAKHDIDQQIYSWLYKLIGNSVTCFAVESATLNDVSVFLVSPVPQQQSCKFLIGKYYFAVVLGKLCLFFGKVVMLCLKIRGRLLNPT